MAKNPSSAAASCRWFYYKVPANWYSDFIEACKDTGDNHYDVIRQGLEHYTRSQAGTVRVFPCPLSMDFVQGQVMLNKKLIRRLYAACNDRKDRCDHVFATVMHRYALPRSDQRIVKTRLHFMYR